MMSNADFADIALKAQPDGSIECRASANGLISLTPDGSLVWSREHDPTAADQMLDALERARDVEGAD